MADTTRASARRSRSMDSCPFRGRRSRSTSRSSLSSRGHSHPPSSPAAETMGLHPTPAASLPRSERTNAPTTSSSTSALDVRAMLHSAMDFGVSVNKDLSVPLHKAGCAPCFEYARHVATFAPLGVTLQNLNDNWTKKLDIKRKEDVAYNDGRRRSYVADTECINSLKATIESLEGQLQAAKADLESARTTIARLEDPAAQPAIPWAAAMAVDPPAPATLQSRLLPADAGLVVPTGPPAIDKGKSKAPIVPNPAALSARIDDP